jgi:Tol biopolymer transport system component
MIAFARLQTDHTTGLFVMNPDGTGERRLDDPASGGNVQAVAWSPDGSRIAVYDSFDRTMNQPVLRVIGADGSEAHVVRAWSNEGCCAVVSVDSLFAWSPDGGRIGMVQADASGRPGILLVNADGSGDLIASEGGYFHWSPDGSRLVVSDAGLSTATTGGDPTASYSIYVVNRDGSGRRWLANGEYPAWGPLPSR